MNPLLLWILVELCTEGVKVRRCKGHQQDLPGLTGGHAHLRWAPSIRPRFYWIFSKESGMDLPPPAGSAEIFKEFYLDLFRILFGFYLDFF